MHYEFKFGLYIYFFDITLAEGGRNRQPVFSDPDIQLFRKAGHEIKRGVNRKLEYHNPENSSISNQGKENLHGLCGT